MSEPQDHSASEHPPGGAPGADRFWRQFGRASGRAGFRDRPQDPPRSGNGSSEPPPAADRHHECVEWCPICRTAGVLRAGAPPELREGWQRAQRDALITLRALLDAYIERLGEEQPASAHTVEDIPIS